MTITIYCKDNCPNCDVAKQLVTAQGHSPRIVKLGDDITREAFFARFHNAKTVPQIEINGQHIGGLTALQAYMSDHITTQGMYIPPCYAP